MTQTGYSNAIVNAMLGWLKGLAGWVLKLFNLSGGGSPLKFLANNWLKLLIFFMLVGILMDLLVWLLRWRPHWIWFRKKRVIINDKNFFAGEKFIDDAEEERGRRRGGAPRAWEDREFVVESKVVRRRKLDAPARRPQPKSARGGRTNAGHVKSFQLEAPPAQRRAQAAGAEHTDVFRDDLFNVNAKQKFSDKYEDEVFNVANLPRPERKPRPEERRIQE